MITLLRKIRKTLIESGSTRSYVLYAIGEIALVVIGILIALQINNWNEAKKERLFEIKMLNEVRTELMLDTAHFQMLLARCVRVDSSVNRILAYYQSGMDDMDYFKKHAQNIRLGYNFDFHSGAYEALKASGAEKISNDELRKVLIELYDFILPRINSFLQMYQSPEWHLLEDELERELYGYRVFENNNGVIFLGNGEYRLERADDPLFMKYLEMKEDESGNGLRRIRGVLNRVEEVLNLLNDELGGSLKG